MALSWAVVNRVAPPSSERGDAFQVVYCELLQATRSAELRNSRPLSKFLFGRGVDALIRYLKRERRESSHGGDELVGYMPADPKPNRVDEMEFVRAHLHVLSEKNRDAIELVYLMEVDQHRAAGLLGVKIKALQHRLRKGIAQLRKRNQQS